MPYLMRLFFILVGAVALYGCSGGAGSLPPLPASSSSEYHLDTGDEVRVFVYGLDSVNNTYIINDEGSVTLPLVGAVNARGMSVSQLEQAIGAQLVQRQIVNSPNVNVQAVTLRPFYILGEVRNPGQYPYQHNMTVLSAVSTAGGYTFRADQNQVSVTRTVDGRSVTGRADESTLVQPGDTIRVYEKWF